MPDTMAILSGLCIIFTVGMFSTGLSDLRKMFSTRSVENIQFLPFLTTDLNNLGWFYYGYLKEDWTLMTVNSIGITLQTLYIMVYLRFTPEKGPVLLKCLASLAVLVVGYCYFYLQIPDVAKRLDRLGLFFSIFTIGMYMSPLTDLAKIIKTKSTKCLSFSLTVATFLTSTSWVLYGMQMNDLYIMVPNVPGILTSVLRFWLFWQYPPEKDVYSYRQVQA
ncbi:sugar transporter SWEET1 [Ambystoma mexicanum]|uniref:sugar transporter SWEET1 n=1 Tax=Ambystoma mexicanum TaxID=8296 RepID=UPI0037E93E0E